MKTRRYFNKRSLAALLSLLMLLSTILAAVPAFATEGESNDDDIGLFGNGNDPEDTDTGDDDSIEYIATTNGGTIGNDTTSGEGTINDNDTTPDDGTIDGDDTTTDDGTINDDNTDTNSFGINVANNTTIDDNTSNIDGEIAGDDETEEVDDHVCVEGVECSHPPVEHIYQSFVPTLMPARGRAGTFSVETISPMDLDTKWVSYDNYFNPNWLSSSNVMPTTPPADWLAIHPSNLHPFFAFYDSGYEQASANAHKTNNLVTATNGKQYGFIDLNTPLGLQYVNDHVLKDKFSGDYKVAPVSRHIFADKDASNNERLTFIGYGDMNTTDFAYMPITHVADDVKVVSFDIDANAVISHTLRSFGALVNAGIQPDPSNPSEGWLKGYFVSFTFDGGGEYETKGYLYLHDYSTKNVNDNVYSQKFQRPAGVSTMQGVGDGHNALINDQKLSNTLIDLTQSEGRKIRFEMEITGSSIVVRAYKYINQNGNIILDRNNPIADSSNSTQNPNEVGNPNNNSSKNLTDTGFSGIGMFANYKGRGQGHNCERLSFVRFDDLDLSAKDYTIRFMLNDGSGAEHASIPNVPMSGSVQSTGNTMPSDPVRNGYVFDGWYLNPSDTSTEFKVDTQIKGQTMVYARWVEVYQVTVNPGDSTLDGSKTPQVIEVIPSQPIGKLPSVVPDPGYSWTGEWTDGTTTWPSTKDMEDYVPGGNMTITPVIKADYTVNYVGGSYGTLTGGPTGNQETLKYNNKPTSVPSVTVTNNEYAFVGWKSNINGDSKIYTEADIKDTAFNQNVTFTAEYRAKEKYTVTYTPGSNGSLTGGPAGGSETVITGETVVNVPTPVPDNNYIFVEWVVNDSGNPGQQNLSQTQLEDYVPKGNTTAEAKFVIKPSITFEAGSNGSISGGSPQTDYYMPGTSVTSVPQTTPDTNFEFLYWEGSDNTKYYTDSDVKNITLNDGDSYTLTAVFGRIASKDGVTYKAGAGGELIESNSVIPEKKYTAVSMGEQLSSVAQAPAYRAKDGYKFKEWQDKNGNAIDPSIAVVGDNTTLITAIFERQAKVDVRFETKGGGKLTGTTTFTIYDDNLPTSLSKSEGGFTAPTPDTNGQKIVFVGWEYDNANIGMTIGGTQQVKYQDNVIYAVFKDDKDGDGKPDEDQGIITVEFRSKDPLKGNLSGIDSSGAVTYKVLERNDVDTTLTNAIADSGSPQFSAVPKTNPIGNNIFYRWEDASGNEVADPATAKLTGSTVVFYAHFEEDDNGDKIPDILQNVYTVTFRQGTGTLAGANASGEVVFKFIGGTQGDGQPLNKTHCVTTYRKLTPIPQSNQFKFNGWTLVSGNSIVDFDNPSVTGDAVYAPEFNELGYNVKFVSGATVFEDIKNIKNTEKVQDRVLNASFKTTPPAGTSSQTFSYWLGSNGMQMNHPTAMLWNPDCDVTFTAVFAKKGLNK